MPKPVFCAMLTQPDQTSAAEGMARTSSGQDRMVRVWCRTVPDRSGGRTASETAAGPERAW